MKPELSDRGFALALLGASAVGVVLWIGSVAIAAVLLAGWLR